MKWPGCDATSAMPPQRTARESLAMSRGMRRGSILPQGPSISFVISDTDIWFSR